MHVAFIHDAHRWMRQLCTDDSERPRPLERADVEQALGKKIRRCDLWVANWRNRVYRVELDGGGVLVAKQACVPPYEQSADEHRQLVAFGRLAIPGLGVPRPVAMMPARHAFVMELVEGRTIAALFRAPQFAADACAACERAGRALARLHLTWTAAAVPAPVGRLTTDLARMPGGLSPRQRDVLRRALEVVAESKVAVGPLYLDFKAENVLVAGNRLTFLDPPHAARVGVLLWDRGTFAASLRWQLWKRLVGPHGRQRVQCFRECTTRFELGYRDEAPHLAASFAAENLLTHLLELQQIGQLLAYQTGKLRLARRKGNPLAASGHYLREIATTLAWLPVLRLRKHWLFDRLDELSRARERARAEDRPLVGVSPAAAWEDWHG